jgi:hypothetical protein
MFDTLKSPVFAKAEQTSTACREAPRSMSLMWDTFSIRSNAVDQANLLVVAMAERCLKIIQDKLEDVRSGLPEPLRPKHLRWMCSLIVEHAEDWPAINLHRWIGFIQAGMIANLMLDLDGAKAMFNKIKEEYGSIAKDQDLIDHLDPQSSFKMDLGGQG